MKDMKIMKNALGKPQNPFMPFMCFMVPLESGAAV